MLTLTFSNIQALVLRMHAPASRPSIKSRFRYFQRLGFLEGTNYGPRRPSTYDLDQTLQVLVAFELSQAGLTPAKVISMLTSSWPRLRKSMKLGWYAATQPNNLASRELLSSEPSALADGPDDGVAPHRTQGGLESVSADAPGHWTTSLDGSPRRLFIDPARMLLKLRASFVEVTGMPLYSLDEAFSAL